MITEISRNLDGTYYASNTTIVFDSNPYLLPTNDLTLYFETTNDARFADKVQSISGNTAVISLSNPQYDGKRVTAITPNFGSGLTGPQSPFSFKTTPPPNVLLQAVSNGGTANVKIQASTDQAHWVDLATLSLTTANSNTAYTTVTSPWPYGRLNITDISTGNWISIYKAI